MTKDGNPDHTPENELSPLLDEGETFKGYTIREWTLKQLVQISPVLETMVAELERRGVTWEQFAAIFEGAKSKSKADSFSMTGAFKMLNGVLPFISSFLAISLRTDPADMEGLSGPLAMTLLLKVVARNLEHLKSFFEDLTREAAGIRERTGTLSTGASQ